MVDRVVHEHEQQLDQARTVPVDRRRHVGIDDEARRRHERQLVAGQRLVPCNVAGCYVPTGRYAHIAFDGKPHRLYFEEAGQGIPLLCLHPAGSDGRQYRAVLNDREITKHYRVIAFDMPYHGRSNPPDGWWLEKYRLTTRDYLAQIRAVWLALGLAVYFFYGRRHSLLCETTNDPNRPSL